MNPNRNPLGAFGRAVIHAIDRTVRRIYRIHPFTQDQNCILRINHIISKKSFSLSEGIQIKEGDRILGLHLWNSRVSDMQSDLASLGWSRKILKAFQHSLVLLAENLPQIAEDEAIVALRAEIRFVSTKEPLVGIFEGLGFDVFTQGAPGFRPWRRAFWDNLYALLLMWTYNPESSRGKNFTQLLRMELWMSRSKLLKMYHP